MFSLNTTYLFVVKYTFTGTTAADTLNDPISVYCLPSGTSLASEPTTPEISNYLCNTKVDASDLGFVTLRQGSTGAAPTLVIDGIRVSTSWNGVVKSWNKVTFNLNTCTRQDTIRPGTAMVQVRGDTPPLTWGNDALNMTNIGGDYWIATATFVNGTAIQYKYFASDWESTNNVNFTITKDTVFPLAYYNNGFTPPYTPSDSLDVWFRVNMGSQPSFNPATDVIGVRGAPATLDWGTSIVLKQEGTTKFFSGVVRFPKSVAGTQIQHKFIIGTSGWESIDNRTWTLNVDTTLAWVTFNNAPIVNVTPDSVRITFMINTATVPDTLHPISTVQVRGNTAPLTWDNTTGVNAVNIGGDYWKATAKFYVAPGQAIQYKFFTNSKSVITGTDNRVGK